MHKDLVECIKAAKHARNAVITKSMSVREANAIAANNHSVLSAHAIDLRERMFLAERQITVQAAPAIEQQAA